jgi:hypothetical protein
VHHLVDHVGAVDAFGDALDAVALEGRAQLVEEVDLRALAQLVCRLAFELALQVGQLGGELQNLLLLGQDGDLLLALQVLLLACKGFLDLGNALFYRSLLFHLQRRDLRGGPGPRLLGLDHPGLHVGEPRHGGGLGLRLSLAARGGDGLLGRHGHLGARVGDGRLLLLAHPPLDAAGDILADRLLAEGAQVALRVRVRLGLAIELEQGHAEQPPNDTVRHLLN